MSNFRAESHVAQQRRRDKLRIQHNSDPTHHLQDFSNNLEQLSVHQGPSPDLTHLRNLKYDPSLFSSEMLNYVTKNMVVHQESTAAQPARPIAGDHVSFAHLPHPVLSNPNCLAKVSGDPQNCSTWKSIGSQQSCDWIVNYPNSSTAIESNQNQNSMFVGDGFSNSLKINNISESSHYLRPIHSSSISNPCSEIFSHQNSQKHYGEMQFNSSPFYQNTLQEVVTSATIGTRGLEMASLAQPNDTNELLLLPNYGDQSNPVCLENASTWINRPGEGTTQWNGELGFLANPSTNDNSSTQGLSLSLSSVPPSKSHESQFDDSEDIRSRTGVLNHLQASKALKSDYLCSDSKPSIGGKGFGNTCHDLGTSAFTNRNTGPLGPFTGYAIILNSSKFMNPTQQLLDEFCSVTCPKPLRTCEVYSDERISEEVRISAEVVNADESVVGAKDGDSGASSSTFYSSNEISGEAAGGRSSSTESYRPEYHQKKAKLLYLQGEVCTRYKQYHQQMQMVVSSFKSVSGLSAATPYISLALKTVSRHFRCLKNAISEQLGHIRKALGEDLSFPTAGTCSSKGDTSTSRSKFIDHSFQKHKSGGRNSGFFEPQPPIWRPQRGLPERAVAILRAWLFDHFLHPYPTDTDKHMLATQTGLTRNQVSNWFINARVRVWKPMVEEIHSLETKGLAEPNSNTCKTDGKQGFEGANRPIDDQPTNRLRISSMSNEEVECSGIGSSAEHRNQEKRSRVDCQIPSTMDGSLMGFVPYERSHGLEIGGLGAVSLTLGLRQSAESAQQQQQQLQQPEHQLSQHFGGQMIHDFGG